MFVYLNYYKFWYMSIQNLTYKTFLTSGVKIFKTYVCRLLKIKTIKSVRNINLPDDEVDSVDVNWEQ